MQSPQIKQFDDYFDPALSLIREDIGIPMGFHSLLPTGAVAHPLRESLWYALQLLHRPDDASAQRALAIIEKVLPLQDQDPVSKTYGIWSWYYEEPLSAMAPPDWNWADFCGFTLAEILLHTGDRLPPALREAARTAIYHAGGSIYRRNVHAGYTNISILGGIVTTLIGELLPEPRLLNYGIRRLEQAVDHHREHGGYSEYNSPTYTRVVLLDTAEALQCIRAPRARECLEYLWRAAWEVIARHFHPATGQWAGPHSRDYRPFLQTEMAYYLEKKTGARIKPSPPMPPKEFRSELHYLPGNPPCPPAFVDAFQRLPQPEYEYKERYIRKETDAASTWGTTWMQEEACLGSVSRDNFSDQRRVVLGYWNGGAGQAVALRLRFLHDGYEFCSAYVHSAQAGPRVLSAVHLLLGRGSIHLDIGVPKNDTFRAGDFRLRYELRGDAVDATKLGDHLFQLSSGDWGATFSVAPARFGDFAVPWQITRGDGWVALDAVCYEGPPRDFPFRELHPVVLVAGLHLHRLDAPEGVPAAVLTEYREEMIASSYAGLKVSIPARAIPLS